MQKLSLIEKNDNRCILQAESIRLKILNIDMVTEEYVGWLNDPEVNRYLEVRHFHNTLETCKEFVASANADPTSYLFGVFNREGKHIGNAKLGFINMIYKRGEISLFIGNKNYWGKGLGYQVVHALTEFGFKQLGLHRVEAGCYADNQASLRVFLKAGYTVEGFKREHVLSDGHYEGCFWLGKLASEHK